MVVLIDGLIAIGMIAGIIIVFFGCTIGFMWLVDYMDHRAKLRGWDREW